MPNNNPSPCCVFTALSKDGKLLHEVILLPAFCIGNLTLESDMAILPTKIFAA